MPAGIIPHIILVSFSPAMTETVIRGAGLSAGTITGFQMTGGKKDG